MKRDQRYKFRDGLQEKILDAKCRDSYARGLYVAASMIKTWNSWAYDKPLSKGTVLWEKTDPFPTVA